MRATIVTTPRGMPASTRSALPEQAGVATLLIRELPAAPMPDWIEPMYALLTHETPSDENNYAFEFKWDGVRALAFISGGNVRLVTRNRIDTTRRYPEVTRPLGR